MSSESRSSTHRSYYIWDNAALSFDDYVVATYEIISTISPELAAYAIARDQTAVNIDVGCLPDQLSRLSEATARVCDVSIVPGTPQSTVVPYTLTTSVYPDTKQGTLHAARIKIAYPVANFGTDVTQLLNFVAGETHRLGFLVGIKLTDIDLPSSYLESFVGPKYGTAGIYTLLGIRDRPILCRSTRPAVGFSTDEIVASHREALLGGFDLSKDDELCIDSKIAPFEQRVNAMVHMIKEVEDITGERKGFIANLICDIAELSKRAEFVVNAGATAVMISPALQGLSAIKSIAALTGLPVLAHNTFADCFTRHPNFGISTAVMHKLSRLVGADFVMLPAEAATASNLAVDVPSCIKAATQDMSFKKGSIKQSLPILAGGKVAAMLPEYVREIGSANFMLIVATAVDCHPEGARYGASQFRASCLAGSVFCRSSKN